MSPRAGTPPPELWEGVPPPPRPIDVSLPRLTRGSVDDPYDLVARALSPTLVLSETLTPVVWPSTHPEEVGGVGGGVIKPGKHARGREFNGQTLLTLQAARFSLLESILNAGKSCRKN